MTKRETITSRTGQLLLEQVVAARSSIQQRARAERGVTLIELCVVMSIMGVLLMPTTNWILDVLAAPLRAMEISQEGVNATSTSEAMDSAIKRATEDTVGLRNPDGSINPVSMAGDQMVFTTAGGRCYRIFYLAHGIDQLRVAENDDGCAAIAPVRGPNQIVDGGYLAAEGEPLYDPVLDDLNNSTLLSPSVRTDGTGGDSISLANQPFSYLDTGRRPWGVDPMADSTSDNPVYSDAAITPVKVSAVSLMLWFGSTGEGPLVVKPVSFTQAISTQLSE